MLNVYERRGELRMKIRHESQKILTSQIFFRNKHNLSARCYISDGLFFLEDSRQSGKFSSNVWGSD